MNRTGKSILLGMALGLAVSLTPSALAADSCRFGKLAGWWKESRTAAPLRAVHRWNRTASRYLEGPVTPVFHFHREPGVLRKAWRFLEDLSAPLARTLFPVVLSRYGSPTRPIFLRQWRDPAYRPAPESPEGQLLTKYGQWEAFVRKQEFMEAHPVWTRVRKWLGRGADGAFMAVYLLVVNHLWQVEEGGMVTDEEYLADEELGPAEDEVQLLYETVPFPHTAIRIGDRVYSYGFTHMHATLVAEYVLSADLHEIYGEEEGQEAGDSSVRAAHRLATATALDRQPRSIQVVTLKVGREERQRLKRYLEDQVLKTYQNRYFVNSCNSMTCRALGSEHLFDASPGITAMTLSLRKTLGDRRVGRVFQVTREGNQPAAVTLIRNAVINLEDGIFHLRIAPYSGAARVHFDATQTEETISYHEPRVKAVFGEWEEEVAREVASDPYLELLELRARALNRVPDATVRERQKALVREQADFYFNAALASARSDAGTTEGRLATRVRGRKKLTLLQQKREEILRILDGE